MNLSTFSQITLRHKCVQCDFQKVGSETVFRDDRRIAYIKTNAVFFRIDKTTMLWCYRVTPRDNNLHRDNPSRWWGFLDPFFCIFSVQYSALFAADSGDSSFCWRMMFVVGDMMMDEMSANHKTVKNIVIWPKNVDFVLIR